MQSMLTALRIPFASPGTIYNNSNTRINAFNANANSAAVHTDLHLRHLENEQLGLGTTLRSGSRDVGTYSNIIYMTDCFWDYIGC